MLIDQIQDLVLSVIKNDGNKIVFCACVEVATVQYPQNALKNNKLCKNTAKIVGKRSLKIMLTVDKVNTDITLFPNKWKFGKYLFFVQPMIPLFTPEFFA